MKLTVLLLSGAGVIATAVSNLADGTVVPGAFTTVLTGVLSAAFAFSVILAVRRARRRNHPGR
ncbi:MAG: hypothetical protein R3B97_07320 [Dehalococcoidia bacterium]|nr:hypothetical protein [Dehalococcoidia bacterium]MCB9485711.1 hypothetical protein [Thermoflexaceae bacterium]